MCPYHRSAITSFNEFEYRIACRTACAMSSLWSRKDFESSALMLTCTCDAGFNCVVEPDAAAGDPLGIPTDALNWIGLGAMYGTSTGAAASLPPPKRPIMPLIIGASNDPPPKRLSAKFPTVEATDVPVPRADVFSNSACVFAESVSTCACDAVST